MKPTSSVNAPTNPHHLNFFFLNGPSFRIHPNYPWPLVPHDRIFHRRTSFFSFLLMIRAHCASNLRGGPPRHVCLLPRHLPKSTNCLKNPLHCILLYIYYLLSPSPLPFLCANALKCYTPRKHVPPRPHNPSCLTCTSPTPYYNRSSQNHPT